jgi:hypothetical protein
MKRHETIVPDWFNLENYSDLQNFTVMQWYEQIAIRRAFHGVFQFSVKPLSDSSSIDSDFAKVLKEPLLDPKLIQGVLIAICREYNAIFCFEKALELFRPTSLPTVRNLARQITVFEDRNLTNYTCDWINAAKDIDSEGGLEKIIDLNKREHGDFDDAAYKMYSKSPRHKKNEVLISINLNFDDTLIIEDLKKQLIEVRAEMAIDTDSKRNRMPNTASWVESKALPYLDLSMWAQNNKVSLTDENYCELLFPYGQKDESNLRKTTKKHSALFLQDGVDDVLDKLFFMGALAK